MNLLRLLLFFGLFSCTPPVWLSAQLILPAFFSDGMVLQRDTDIRIWGKAAPGSTVVVKWQGKASEVKADRSGQWRFEDAPLSAGGPHVLQAISEKDTLTVRDILIGDIWICSGQSNMEWSVLKSQDAEAEIAAADFPDIRLFDLPRQGAFKPQRFFKKPGRWEKAVGDNIAEFSAVAYFFGRALHQEKEVPIGLISTNWGGTNAETWTSSEGLKPFPAIYAYAEKMLQHDKSMEAVLKSLDQQVTDWWAAHFESRDKGERLGWHRAAFKDRDWPEMSVPMDWESAGLEDFDGVVWFRKSFDLPKPLYDKNLFLRLGYIKDYDAVWINDSLVGSTIEVSKWRTYSVPASLLRKDGRNTIAVKILNRGGLGGFVEERADKFGLSEKPYHLSPHDLLLSGTWKYQLAEAVAPGEVPVSPKRKSHYRPNSHPSMLYNAMIHPFTPLAIKGAIWYQGESNARRAEEYRALFPNMIKDWRQQWGQDFPFLFVQLANFRAPQPEPGDSDWAELREAQSMALKLPQTGTATAIDIGEADDIHPRNKQEVGHRLALAARKVAYGEDIVHSGPVFESAGFRDGRVSLSFTNVGSGLIAKDKYGYLKGFAIAGTDRQFHWAQARIEGDQVIVSSPEVPNPVAVRYAWADNPDDANLYNQEGLPALPFRTDEWPGITAGNTFKP